ncbi:fasciclin-2-like isoform X3 [Stegodyphus dumicola]|uniref:fasciclin-2-like isoform X3 n=1 Tax=Stegodyphus dumicola TaxID=202533 RepID=UPI0015AF0BB1|nr:fasciclin-2-like isoform X3 [Stegodyphus dumicola]
MSVQRTYRSTTCGLPKKAFQIILVISDEPKLVIFPNQNSVIIPAGQSYGLICKGESGDPDGTFTEMKWINPRDEEIHEGRPGVHFFEKELKLSFVTPSVEDSGIYKCTALYSNTLTLEAEITINFYEGIRFEDCPEVQNLVVGKEGRIKCKPIANPKPTINWEKNKQRVSSERFSISPSGISISSVSQEDAGVYTVEAFVPATGNNKYRNITVNVLTPPKIIELPENDVAIQGEQYTTTCRADGSTPINYFWYDPESRDLSAVEGYRVEEGRLTISKVERNAGGKYKCRVENPAGEDEDFMTLVVQVRPRVVQFDNQTTETTKSAILECRAEGIPRPSLVIRKENSEPIVSGQNDRMELEDIEEGDDYKVLRLRISDVKRSDDGLYYCSATNAAGNAEKVGHLEVQFRPDMSLTPLTRVKAWSANPANLSCIAEANPNATITWKFQNEPVEHGDDRYKFYGGVSYSSLLVLTEKRAQYEVFGTYTCEARNILGESSVDIILEEATTPGQVTQIVFDKVTSTTITFVFMGPGNDGGLPITTYIMRYKKVGDPENTAITVEWTADTPHILGDLKPRTKYQFSVAARNVVGEGPWKQTEYLMPEETVPEPPAIIAEKDTIPISQYPDRYEIRWEVPIDNGEPILQFGIRYFEVERTIKGFVKKGDAVEKIVRNWDKSPSIELAGLSADTHYKVEIRATNKIGNSLPETIVFRTGEGETNDGQTSVMDKEGISLPVIIAIVLVALFIILVILDVTCFFRFHCGLLYLLRYRTCGRSPEKEQGKLEDGRACVKEVASANNGKIKQELKSPSSPDQLPPPENRDARPVDLIIDENFKNKSPKGSKSSIGKSSPV